MIEREIISIVSGQWDAIWRVDGEYHPERILFVAAVKEYEVSQTKTGETKRRYLGDNVVPIDLNNHDAPLGIIDSLQYIGLVPAGADFTDPLYGLGITADFQDERTA